MFIEALATGAALEIKKRNRKTLQYADLGALCLTTRQRGGARCALLHSVAGRPLMDVTCQHDRTRAENHVLKRQRYDFIHGAEMPCVGVSLNVITHVLLVTRLLSDCTRAVWLRDGRREPAEGEEQRGQVHGEEEREIGRCQCRRLGCSGVFRWSVLTHLSCSAHPDQP